MVDDTNGAAAGRNPIERTSAAPPPAVAPATADLIGASISANTRAAYGRALRQVDAWRAGRPLNDATLADYIAHRHGRGAAPATCAMAVAAVRFAARVAGAENPAGRLTERALAGARRTGADRGRGQAAPMLRDHLAAIVATARQPRRTGRGVESEEAAERRGTLDIAIAGLLFHAGLRRAEVAALTWADVTDSAQVAGAVLVTVRTGKTNQDGDRADVRMVKNGAAAAIRSLRAERGDNPDGRVIPLNPAGVGRRLTAAAEAAGLDGRLTAHSGRVGLASELVVSGASTADVMLAGGWATARMVAHYAAGAKAERGAVARFL